MRRLIPLMVLALTACVAEPLERHDGGNGFSAERIGEIEGCSVWRFADGGGGFWRHAVICPRNNARTTWLETCGKGCTRTVEVPTEVTE